MTECNRNFPEEFLTGYLDQALTQEDSQRVRLHLEECPECAEIYEDMSKMREATMATEFESEDVQWEETPRSGLSRLLRILGLFLLLGWLIVLLGLTLWLPQDSQALWWTRWISASGISGTALVFFSVLIDRLRVKKTDRYLGVKK